MVSHVIIDGNNLLFAMQAHAPIPSVGRETMLRIIERWARSDDVRVSLIFDGPVPRGNFARQMTSPVVTVQFSAPQSADDIIVALIHEARDPPRVRVVTADRAIIHEARARRCGHTDPRVFIEALFAGTSPEVAGAPQPLVAPAPGEKPDASTEEERREWLEHFDDGEFEGFEGEEWMKH